MADAKLQERDSLQLLGLTFSVNMEWKHYIVSSCRFAARRVRSLCYTHFLARIKYTHVIRRCHICSSVMYLDILVIIKRIIYNIIGADLASRSQSISDYRNVASLCLFHVYVLDNILC